MFDKITYMSDNSCHVKLADNADIKMNLMNMHIIFEDDTKKILGEVDDVDGTTLKAKFLGEIVGNKLIGGTIRKPSLDAKIRVIEKEEIPLITGSNTKGFMKLGVSPFYDDYPVYLNVNNFFSNHFAIFGNTGSGKSCGTTRLFQNLFHDDKLNPFKANIFIFDSSGEYYSAFRNLNEIRDTYHYRYISTNETEGLGEPLRLPIYLLNKDDLALLLQCTNHSQLPIIERMLKLALVFGQNDVDSNAYKNHLIAKAIMSILYTNETAPNKRNEIFSIIASCSTNEFNLEAPLQGIGYTRKFRECFLIDNSGNFTESVLLTEYLNSFIKEEFDNYEPHTGVFYDLDTMEKALNFTLISEGWLRNEQTYGDSVTIRVRLHALLTGNNAKYFDVDKYMSLESYLSSLLIHDGMKYQIVNINLNDIDDDFAKVLTKIYSRLIFDFSKGLQDRGSIPFHIVLEEAHRYIQSDQDRFLFGYNIFERIAKEGRKYGVILGLISQRPVEISDTVISQCTNFLIFKINHPMDVDYIRKMVPHITDEIIEKQKSLQPGTCLGFGLAFKIPLIIRMEMPDPAPLSGNCDVVTIWNGEESSEVEEDGEEVVAPISTPVEDTSISLENSSVPVENVSPPVEGASISLENSSIPVENVSPPVEGASISLENSSVPVENVSLPVADASISSPSTNVEVDLESPEVVTPSNEFSVDSTVSPSTVPTIIEIPKISPVVNEEISIPSVSAPAPAITPVISQTVEIPEAKFDDSFVITDSNGFSSASSVPSTVSAPEIPLGVSEIIDVPVNSQGMVSSPESPDVSSLGDSILELTDDDEEDSFQDFDE